MTHKSLLQTPQWAEFKSQFEFEVEKIDNISVLIRKLPLGRSFLYLPEIRFSDFEKINLAELHDLAKEKQAVFIKVEFYDEDNLLLVQKIRQLGFIPSFEQIQPDWRQVLDLKPSMEEILSRMKSKGRYNIKVAERHGIVVKMSNDQVPMINEFYKLYQESAKRERFSSRPEQYFEKMIDSLAPWGYIEVFLAYSKNKPLAGAIVGFYDKVATYIYGGSSREHSDKMATYALHFKIIEVAKNRGMEHYDLLGIAPPEEKKHPWQGLTRFKESFGGKKVKILGGYDYIYSPTLYQAFKLAEKIRR